MPKNHPQFATKDNEGLPIWPSLRTIDGYHYLLDSTHRTKADADKRVAEIRKAGDAAQAFASNNPKFAADGDAFQPAFAGVYTVPSGKKVELSEDSHTVVDRPSRAKPKKASKKPAKKATKKRSSKTEELKKLATKE